jgi:integrase
LPLDSNRKRFDETADEYIRHREATVSEGTVRLEKERLKPLERVIGNVKLKEISSRTIRTYQAARGAQVSNRTVNLEIKLLRGILKSEGQWNRLQEDYKRLSEAGESPGRALNPRRVARSVQDRGKQGRMVVPYQAAIVANDTGMRSVELRNLKLGDIDIDARKITIRRAKGNAGLFRAVILTNDALKAMLKLLDRARKLNALRPEHYLFPYKIRKGVGHDPARPMKGWRTAWRALTIAAGVPGFRFHDLRHTFITNHAEMCTPLAVVQAQAGYLSRRMTELYTHISNRALGGCGRALRAKEDGNPNGRQEETRSRAGRKRCETPSKLGVSRT